MKKHQLVPPMRVPEALRPEYARNEACGTLVRTVLRYLKSSGIGVGLNLEQIHSLGYENNYEGPLGVDTTYVMPLGFFDLGGPADPIDPHHMKRLKEELFELVAKLPEG